MRQVETRVSLLKEVRLHGELAERFGATHWIAASSLGEISRALDTRRPGFWQFLREQDDSLAYRIVVGTREIGPSELQVGIVDAETVDIFPVGVGGGGNVGTLIAGILLIIIGVLLWWTGGAWLSGLGVSLATGAKIGVVIGLAGLSMTITGISGMLAEQPISKTSPEGYGFGGAENVLKVGESVPVLLGEDYCGSAVISFGLAGREIPTDKVFLEPQIWVPRPKAGDPGALMLIGGEEGLVLRDQEARFIDLISADEIEGFPNSVDEDVYYDDSPVGIIRKNDPKKEKIHIDYRLGTEDQTPMTGFELSLTTTTVGKQLMYEVVSSASSSALLSPSVLRVNLAFNALYQGTDKGPRGRRFKATIKVTDANGIVQSIREIEVNRRITTRRNVSYEFNVNGTAPYTIEILSHIPDTSGENASNVTFESLTEVGDVKMSFPHYAVVGHRMLASQFSNSLPMRKYFLRGVKVRVPSNYDPVTRAYTGDWDGTFQAERKWTNNPAWLFLEACTNDLWGIGEYVKDDDIDLWSIYRAAQYADQMVSDGAGGTQPRFTFNAQVTSGAEAWRFLLDMSSAMLGSVYWSGAKLVLNLDRPSEPIMTFTNANVVGGMFSYSDAELSSRINRIMVRFRRPELHGEPDVVTLDDTASIRKIGPRPVSVDAIGCTSRQQAIRYGVWRIKQEALKDGVAFETGMEALSIMPGDLIRVQDGRRSEKKRAGRVQQAARSLVHLDRAVELEEGITYEMEVILDQREEQLQAPANTTQLLLEGPVALDDYRRVRVWEDVLGNGNWYERETCNWNAETRVLNLVPIAASGTTVPFRVTYSPGLYRSTVTNAAGSTNAIVIEDELPQTVTGAAIWLLTEPTNDARLYRVVSVRQLDFGQYEVEGVPHDHDLYAEVDAGVVVSDPDSDVVPPDLIGVEPAAVVGLTGELLNQYYQGRWRPVIYVTWALPPLGPDEIDSVTGFRLSWYVQGELHTEPLLLGETAYTIPVDTLGLYEITVVSVQAWTSKISEARAIAVLANSDTIPRVQAKVTGLRVSGRQDNQWVGAELHLEWRINIEGMSEPANSDLDQVGTILSQPDLFDAYEVTVYNASEPNLPVLRTAATREASWTYTWDMNVADAGTGEAIDDVIVEVGVRDHLGRLSEISRIHCVNPPPELPTLVSAQGVGSAIQFEFNYASTDPDLEGVVIWVADDANDLTDTLLLTRPPAYLGPTRGYLSVPVQPRAGVDDGENPPENPPYFVRFACYDSFALSDIERLVISGIVEVEVADALGSLVVKAAAIDWANINALVADQLDARVLKAQTMSADVLAAGSLRVDRLILGSFDNLIGDPGFETNDIDAAHVHMVTGGGAWDIANSGARSGDYALRYTTSGQTTDGIFTPNSANPSQQFGFAQAGAGNWFYFEAWARRVTPNENANVRVEIEFRSPAGNLVGTAFTGEWGGNTDSYQRVFVSGECPAGAAYAVPRVRVRYNAGGTATAYLIDDLYMRRQVSTGVIEDGAVTNRILEMRSPSTYDAMPEFWQWEEGGVFGVVEVPGVVPFTFTNPEIGEGVFAWHVHEQVFNPRADGLLAIRARGCINFICTVRNCDISARVVLVVNGRGVGIAKLHDSDGESPSGQGFFHAPSDGEARDGATLYDSKVFWDSNETMYSSYSALFGTDSAKVNLVGLVTGDTPGTDPYYITDPKIGRYLWGKASGNTSNLFGVLPTYSLSFEQVAAVGVPLNIDVWVVAKADVTGTPAGYLWQKLANPYIVIRDCILSIEETLK